MKKGAVFSLRLALLALIFQLVCPLFISVVTLNNDFQSRVSKTSLHATDHSVSTPVLLKEKDESETEVIEGSAERIALIDFSHLSLSLSESHTNKITPILSFLLFDNGPPLFNLNSTFLI